MIESIITNLHYYWTLPFSNSIITNWYYYRTGYYRTVLLRFVNTECCTLQYNESLKFYFYGLILVQTDSTDFLNIRKFFWHFTRNQKLRKISCSVFTVLIRLVILLMIIRVWRLKENQMQNWVVWSWSLVSAVWKYLNLGAFSCRLSMAIQRGDFRV